MAASPSQADLDQRQLDFDPGKGKQDFRVYTTDTTSGVYIHYSQMRANQCIAFADAMESRVFDWSKRTPLRMTVREAFVQLAKFVDRSDPDIELPNLIHMLQTSERAREAGRPDWFQLVWRCDACVYGCYTLCHELYADMHDLCSAFVCGAITCAGLFGA